MTGPAADRFAVFGTTAVLLVTDADALPAARRLADAELAAIDKACSRFRPDSELSMLNSTTGEPFAVSELLAELIEQSLRAAELTDGDVDPTCASALTAAGYNRDFGELRSGSVTFVVAGRPVPGWTTVRLDPRERTVSLDRGAQLDLGSTAKAVAADRCAALIADDLGCGVLISLGGDIAVAGPAPDGGWQVNVTDDHAAGPHAAGQVVEISAGGLATSSTTVRAWTAGGRQMHHIIDPRTGEPAVSCWRTVSVAAVSCADANIASTAAIIRSEAAPRWLEAAGMPARLVRHDGSVVVTAGWPSPRPSAGR